MTSNIHKSLYDFSKDLVGKDLFDQYITQRDIKKLESSTPISIRLLSGKDNFKKCIPNKRKIKDSCTLPIIYHHLNKLKDIKHKINMDSELPLGMLMLNNDIFKSTNSNTLDFKDYLKLTLSIKQMKYLRDIFGNIEISPTTLVPLKLICKRKCPFIDDPLLEEYLTLIDLPKSSVDNTTMIPLGILLIMKKLHY